MLVDRLMNVARLPPKRSIDFGRGWRMRLEQLDLRSDSVGSNRNRVEGVKVDVTINSTTDTTVVGGVDIEHPGPVLWLFPPDALQPWHRKRLNFERNRHSA